MATGAWSVAAGAPLRAIAGKAHAQVSDQLTFRVRMYDALDARRIRRAAVERASHRTRSSAHWRPRPARRQVAAHRFGSSRLGAADPVCLRQRPWPRCVRTWSRITVPVVHIRWPASDALVRTRLMAGLRCARMTPPSILQVTDAEDAVRPVDGRRRVSSCHWPTQATRISASAAGRLPGRSSKPKPGA